VDPGPEGRITATFKDQKPSVRYTFNTLGEYTMHLTVTNALGSATGETGGIDVLERIPVTPVITSFTRSPQSPTQNQQVTFTAVVDNGEDFLWDWVLTHNGSVIDGSRNTGSFTTTVSEAGEYRIDLTVSDSIQIGNDCSCARASDTFSVSPQVDVPPVARLAISPDSGPPPLAVDADASASTDDNGIATYQFDFGDGTTVGPQSAPTASHTYRSAGTFTVTVTVTDTGGNTDRDSATVTVTAVDNTPPSVTLTATNLPGPPSVSAGSGNRTLQVTAGAEIQLQVVSNDSGSGIAETRLLILTGNVYCSNGNTTSVRQGLSTPIIVNSNQISRSYTTPTCPSGWSISASGSFSASATDDAGNKASTGELTFSYSS
jgi:PKD repeat protein